MNDSPWTRKNAAMALLFITLYLLAIGGGELIGAWLR